MKAFAAAAANTGWVTTKRAPAAALRSSRFEFLGEILAVRVAHHAGNQLRQRFQQPLALAGIALIQRAQSFAGA